MDRKISEIMGRRGVTEKGARRILDIVRTGVEILLSDGFTALTKRRIASRLGISHGNVSYYFPTRAALWQGVIEHEISEKYQNHYSGMDDLSGDPELYFAEYLKRWIDEFRDPELRIFYSQFFAFAEINEAIAELRREIFERFVADSTDAVRPIVPDVSRDELEDRVLTTMALLEGMQPITGFRPALLEQSHPFRERLEKTIHCILREGLAAA